MSLEAGLLGSMRGSGAPVRTSLPEEVAPFAGGAAGESRTAVAVATPVWTGKTLWGAIVVTRAGALAGARAEEHLERVANLLSLALAGADARRQLAMLASTDHLTGLPNRRSFEERLAAEVQRAGRHDRPLALVVFDIDNFKEINDTWGHEVGDRVLVELAGRLAAHARSGETVARVGGEEFAWILPEADAMGAIAAAERASRAIAAAPFDDVGVVTVSGGVCDLEQAPGANELFRSADVALYWAKAQGRNAVFRYAPEVVELLSAEEQRDRLQRAQTLGGIRAIAQAIDAKDTATQRHSERVATLAYALALEDGWHPDDAARVREAALVHDVGKIGVPDVVLMKPGRLTAQEYAQIQEHPELGARMVEGLLSDECVPWVRHHHERWDGEGYPAGLAGPEIPKGARILALADALDAMVTARPYAPRLTIDDAVREARACAGTQFDPQVVTLLERLHGSGRLPEAEQPVPPPEGVGTPLVDPTATAERP
jgi:diguanylate cyclase (GGDEF)-like protein